MWTDRPWLMPLLALSVLLNLFLVGIVAGHAYRAPKNGPRLPLLRQTQLKTLPAAERTLFETTMSARKEEVSTARRTYLAARRAVIAELAAPAYDRGKIDARLAEMRRAGLAMQEKANAALVDALSTLPPASRRAVVNIDRSAPDTAGETN